MFCLHLEHTAPIFVANFLAGSKYKIAHILYPMPPIEYITFKHTWYAVLSIHIAKLISKLSYIVIKQTRKLYIV